MKIERLPESRWKECQDLRLEALKEEPLAFGSSFEEENTFSEKEWKYRSKNALFALSNNIPVGMIVFIRQSNKKNSHIANIFGFYVSRTNRGRGIGESLLNQAIYDLSRLEGLKKISLTVNTEQKEAIALYSKMGFKEVGKLHKELYYEGNFYDELIMELFI